MSVTSLGTVTVRPGGPEPARARWYRALAYALGATAESGALFEATLVDPIPFVTLRPGSLLSLVRDVDGRCPLDVLEEVPNNAREPPRAWTQSWRALIAPFPRTPISAYRSELGRESLAPAGDLAGPAWLAVQTHWLRGSRGEIWITRRFRGAAPSTSALEPLWERVAPRLAEEWAFRTGTAAAVAPAPRGIRRDWATGRVRSVPDEGWWKSSIDTVPGTAELRLERTLPALLDPGGHAVVFGASGAGKTTFLADQAARAMLAGSAVVVVDLHGDLAPAVVARVPAAFRSRIVSVDATDRPVPGIAALATPGGRDDAAAAHLVAALKRLSPDGQDLYWGFRLERIFDSFVRLAQESGGTLLDVYDLLTDATRRDAARLGTSRTDLARFLDEIAPIVRRQPEFLWSAATRLAKVVLVPALAELLAPADGGLPVEDLLAAGRSLLVRLPFATLGPEASTFAGSLVLGRIYLGLAARRSTLAPTPPIVVTLDEAHAFSPRLVAELLTESRKFGIRVVLATQFPERLASEVRASAAGAPSEFVAFRVPPALAGSVGGWIGLPREEGERWLPELPVGHGVRRDPATGSIARFCVEPSASVDGPDPWLPLLQRTREEFSVAPECFADPGRDDDALERLLLAVMAAEEGGRPADPGQAILAALDLPGPPLAPERLGDPWNRLVRERLVRVEDEGCRLTEAGARRLGVTAETGAVSESGAHRALLLATFRLFARRGYRIEIVRQGRFDTTLPDGRFRQLVTRPNARPEDLAAEIDRVRDGWAWRFFHGRDVHIEVEVSGALRAERIRRGWRKASERGAFALFVVGDAARARRVRKVLRDLSLRPDRAQVWTLRTGVRPVTAGTPSL